MTDEITPDIIIKLGGSHAESPLLRRWLRVIAQARGAVVLVPGGGPFADAVRQAQPRMGFDDGAAHDMALLAMTQYGRGLVALEPRLALADTIESMVSLCRAGRVAVWSPWPMLRDETDVPASWDVTSDSLSLWLAREMGALRLLLVKHCTTRKDMTSSGLVRDGILDPAFPRFMDGYSGAVYVAGPDDLPGVGLDPATPPGQAILA